LKVAQAGSFQFAETGIDSFTGEVQEHTTRDKDGSESSILNSPRMGTVKWTDGANRRNWRLEAPAITPGGLAEQVDRVVPLSSPVIDMTALKGRYQMVLEVLLNAPAENASMADRDEAVLKAFNDGLRKPGLQLEPRRGPVETLIVDHVEKTPTEN